MNFPMDMKPDRKTLQALLAVAALSLAGLFSWEIYAGGQQAGDGRAGGSRASAAEKSGADIQAGPMPKEFYRVVSAKDLFSPGRSQSSSAAPAAVMPGEGASSVGYALEGVFILGSRSTAIIKKAGSKAARTGGEVFRVKVGDAVDQYRVTHIGEDGIVMVAPSGAEKKLGLFSIESATERSHAKTTQTIQAAPADPGAFMPQPRPRGPMPGALPGQVPGRSGITPNR